METKGKVESRETKRKRTEKNWKRPEEDENREKVPDALVDKKEGDNDEEPCCSQGVSSLSTSCDSLRYFSETKRKCADRDMTACNMGHQRAAPPSSITASGGSIVISPSFINSSVQNVNIKLPLGVQMKDIICQAAQCGDTKPAIDTFKEKNKARLRKEFVETSEGTEHEKIPLNSIFTPLYVTEGESEGVNKEHEIMHIKYPSSGKQFSDKPIQCNDIFKAQPDQVKEILTVLMKGIAGIGKTVSVQKFILDWAEGKANQDVDFIFVLPFRELNLIKGDRSLYGLLNEFHPELKEIEDMQIFESHKVLFIFDGLDETRLPLDFPNNERVSDVTTTSPVDVLLTNILKKNLLPSALIWITSRPAATSQIPRRIVNINLVTEVRGFTEEQKNEYFMKRFFDNEELAKRIISHIKKTRSLHIMCYIPVMCWISAKVLEHMLNENESGNIPTSLTEMYIHFLITQTNLAKEKYQGESIMDEEKILELSKDLMLKLGKLAFDQLMKGSLIFYEEDLKKCGIDVNEAAVKCGLCTEILKVERGLYRKKVYCFVHLSFQEFLAALYVYYCCVTKKISALESLLENVSSEQHLNQLLKRVVDKALQSKNGHLDLFLRFLLGISLESNLTLLQGLLPQIENSETVEEMRKYLRKPDVPNILPERHVNLFLCLTEMKDSSVNEDIHNFLLSRDRDINALSGDHCSALANALLMSPGMLDEMDLRKYNIEYYYYDRLMPAVAKCKKALLTDMKPSHEDWVSLASCLQSPDCPLRELDLRDIRLSGDDLSVVFSVLEGPPCKLETLRLTAMDISKKAYASLASSFQSPNCPLRKLHLAGIKLSADDLSAVYDALRSPLCKLMILRLKRCFLTEDSCGLLASALSSNCHLKELDLRHSELSNSGVKILSDGLRSPHCRLEILRLAFCRVTEEGCAYLASALSSNCHLMELDLSYNHPGDTAVNLLSDPRCRLEKLNVDHNDEIWVKPQMLKKYTCDLTLDPNTATRHLSLSGNNRKVDYVEEDQPYPDHPEGLDEEAEDQVLCREVLTGRHYWEVEMEGKNYSAMIGVTYKSIKTKGNYTSVGQNDASWGLFCGQNPSVWHKNEQTAIPDWLPLPIRVGVYLDWPAGILSFYSISSDTLTRLYTFHTTFTEPLQPVFGLDDDTSVTLCPVEYNGLKVPQE
ncbi:NACHT, LRR and PYD domains-containing protein 12-like isoform X1 [Hypomesus transpacificus]|uniref:NACHT, LRR and PYD domains-containing protein 12-like isoform X1 n=2 Tax=Hypomesus transpacificus TaxID=137520 RepID=UPI001F081A6B|nr:NACHT, LRR and PYD domains-containing protein 12-like isoform X1 [Hypomesus transpacificus]XP_046899490.1 NACHT, LRR and PYD domains-containing protein 12-like isoform X1 [Hypomesus transpacificus]